MKWRCKLCGAMLELSPQSFQQGLAQMGEQEQAAFLRMLEGVKDLARAREAKPDLLGLVYGFLMMHLSAHPERALELISENFEQVE